MIKFRSKASGEVQMLDAHGAHLLSIIGKDHTPQGVITPAEMNAAIASLMAAAREDDSARASHNLENDDADSIRDSNSEPETVGLSQRSFPFVEMLKRSQAAGEAITWGL